MQDESGVEDHTKAVNLSLEQSRSRHQARHAMILDCFRHLIADSTVLCLGAGDGQWCRDLAMAGALHVLGVEDSAALVESFRRSAGLGAGERIEMIPGNPQDILSDLAAERRQFDVVVSFDLFENTGDLASIFTHLMQLRPRIVFADGLITRMDDPVLRLQRVRSKAQVGTQMRLVPSPAAIEMVAKFSGFDVDWTDWEQLPETARAGLADYFRSGPVVRSSLTMLPQDF
ncbi:MAG: class I SAM-dependent methyltransferase [Pseudomonadota bacterium]